MIELLWILGFLSVLLVFGVYIGLSIKYAGLSKKFAVSILIGYGAGILVLSRLADIYSPLYSLVYNYGSIIFLLIAIVMIYSGFHIINKWKINKEFAKHSNFAMISLIPCCFGSVLTVVILVSHIIGSSSYVIGQYAAVILVLIIALIYLAYDIINGINKKSIPIVLGNSLVFNGLFFLVAALVFPNISSVLTAKMSPLEISSPLIVLYIAIVTVLIMLIGGLITKKRSDLIQK
jgi:predicted transporter